MPVLETMAVISAILAAGKVGTGIAGLAQANKVPKELQEAFNIFQQQAREGLPASLENQMISQGTTRINRVAGARQNAAAMALASRGTGSSTAADQALDRVTAQALDEIGQLNTNVQQLDFQARQNAQNALAGISGTISGLKQQQRESASSLITSGVLDFFDEDLLAGLNIVDKPEDPLAGLIDAVGNIPSPQPLNLIEIYRQIEELMGINKTFDSPAEISGGVG